MKGNYISLVPLIGLVFITGCVGSIDPTQIDVIQSFLEDNPGAAVKTLYLTEVQVLESEEIKELCGSLNGPLHRIEVTSDSLSMIAFVDVTGNVLCSVSQSDGDTTIVERDVPFETVSQGQQGVLNEKQNIIIKTQGEWDDFRERIRLIVDRKTYEEPALPFRNSNIDFDKEMVVVVYMGQRNTGGYSTEITQIKEREDEIRVYYRETSPSFGGSNGDAVTQALTSPYHIIKLEKIDKGINFIQTSFTGGRAFVDSVDVLIMESFPVQINAVVKGYLNDGCTSIHEVNTRQAGNTFLIDITTSRPKDVACTHTVVSFEEVISLDVYGLKTGRYEVRANDVVNIFTLEADNIPPATVSLKAAKLVLSPKMIDARTFGGGVQQRVAFEDRSFLVTLVGVQDGNTVFVDVENDKKVIEKGKLGEAGGLYLYVEDVAYLSETDQTQNSAKLIMTPSTEFDPPFFITVNEGEIVTKKVGDMTYDIKFIGVSEQYIALEVTNENGSKDSKFLEEGKTGKVAQLNLYVEKVIKITETEEKCVAKHSGYSSGDYGEGEIIIGFNRSVTQQEAEKIFTSYDLTIRELHNLGDSYSWAVVYVPKGQEIKWVCKLPLDNRIDNANLNFIFTADV
jgi:hypothetical protein